MKINILRDTFECDNTYEAVEEILKKVDEIIASSKLVLSYIIINGVEVYNNFHENIVNNLDEIENIEVILKSQKEIVDETLEATYKYIETMLSNLDNLVSAFYTEDGSNLWNKFGDFLDALNSIMETLNFLIKNQQSFPNPENYNVIEKNLSSNIKELGVAMEIGDRVCISDLIIYEITPLLEMLNKEIKISIGK